MKTSIITCSIFLATAITCKAQFSEKKGIGQCHFSGEHTVHSFDLDGDGDQDILVPNRWFKNNGNGRFEKRTIGDQSEKQSDIFAVDLDDDKDLDVVLSNSYRVAWCENDGSGSFSAEKVIVETKWDYFVSVYSKDVDGDGKMDVLATSEDDQTIFWCKNNGDGTFSDKNVIYEKKSSDDPPTIRAADLDGDGDMDVISATLWAGELAWFENMGSGSFSSRNLIHNSWSRITSIHVIDLNGDSSVDVITATNDDSLVWYENKGVGVFSTRNLISTSADHPNGVYADDLDGDGDIDVLSASKFDDKIAWFENDGNENFTTEHVINDDALEATAVYASDLNGDNDMDVVSISDGNEINWYEYDTTTIGGFRTKSRQLLYVYPNPTADILRVSLLGQKLGESKIALHNVQGVKMIVDIEVKENSAFVHVNHLPNGVYNLIVRSGATTVNKLITVLH